MTSRRIDWRAVASLAATAAVVLLGLMGLGASAQPTQTAPAPQPSPTAPQSVPYGPFNGNRGYQEIVLSADSWYVAFHGSASDSGSTVQLGWAARAAQLCEGLQRAHFVELKYVGEPVLSGERAAAADEGEPALQRVAGMVYIPIYVPVRPRVPVITPSKMAPMRCIAEPGALNDRSRASAALSALQEARAGGLKLP